MSANAENVASEIINHLERAWNAADGQAFGEPFTADADFVDIRGEYHRSREAIAAGHQGIFDSIYKGSSMKYELLQARKLTDDVILAHSRGTLTAPAGPLAGTHNAVQSLVLIREGNGWKIASFHNTLVAQQR
ncbi:MAG TPA: SgcJ/EcaC family oxidoreductase [Thermoanaerobaculia bacterium]